MLWIVFGVIVLWLLGLLFVVGFGADADRGDRLRRRRRTDGRPASHLARRLTVVRGRAPEPSRER